MNKAIYLVVLLLTGCGTFVAEPRYSRIVLTWDVVEEERVSEKCGFNATACAKWRGNVKVTGHGNDVVERSAFLYRGGNGYDA